MAFQEYTQANLPIDVRNEPGGGKSAINPATGQRDWIVQTWVQGRSGPEFVHVEGWGSENPGIVSDFRDHGFGGGGLLSDVFGLGAQLAPLALTAFLPGFGARAGLSASELAAADIALGGAGGSAGAAGLAEAMARVAPAAGASALDQMEADFWKNLGSDATTPLMPPADLSGTNPNMIETKTPGWEKLLEGSASGVGAGALATALQKLAETAGSTVANMIPKLLEGGLDAKYLPALIGAIIGATQNKPAPTTTDVTPWNANFLNVGQDAALRLLGTNQLNLPQIPQLPQADDRFLQRAISAAIDPTTRDLLTRVLPQVRSDFGDQYGGSRMALAEGNAVDLWSRNAGHIGAQLSQAFYPWMENFNRGAIQWPYEQATGQATALFEAPWKNVQNAANIFTGAAGKGATTTMQTPSTPWWVSGAGGALAAQGVWDKLFPVKQ